MSSKQLLFENFLSLSVLQVISYLLPLLIYSKLVLTIGAEKFGLIFFVFAFIQYFVILCDWGFDLSATRETALNRHNIKSLSNIFNSVLIIKLILVLISVLIVFAFVSFIPKFNTNSILYYTTFGIILGSAVFPVWFFPGLERMKYIAVFKLLSQFIFLFLFFVC